MMKKSVLLILVFFMVCEMGVAQVKCPVYKEISWLMGKWMKREGTTKQVELWSKFDEETLVMKNYLIKGTDTSELQGATIILGKECIYKVTQEGKYINYKLTYFKDKKMVFESSEVKFPQKITLDRGDVALIITKEGVEMDKGKEKKKKEEIELKIVGR